MNMSMTMGVTKIYNSDRRHSPINKNADLTENAFVRKKDVSATPLFVLGGSQDSGFVTALVVTDVATLV